MPVKELAYFCFSFNFMNQQLKLLFGLLFLLFCSSSFAQTISYKEMMHDTKYNYYDVVKVANLYFDEHGRGEGSGWKGFERWRNENESKFYPTGVRSDVDFYMVTNQYKEIVREQNLKTKTSFENGWNELGPWNANNITSHYSPGIGRIETFWVNPTNTNEMFIGSRSGGFWKTTNGGSTWKNTTDFLVASGVFSIAVNPFDKKEILIAVQQGGNEYTHGIYRSKDGGETWALSNFEPITLKWGGLGDNERIYVIKYHPTIQNRVYVGCTQGFYYSTNNLTSWTRAFTGSPTDIEFHPIKKEVVYVYNNSGTDRNLVKLSSDTGETFTNSQSLVVNNNSKGHLSVSTANSNNVYFASTSGVWKSNDEGQSFSYLSNPDESCLGFAISDIDTMHMVYGYVDAEASSDGGVNFSQVTRWAVQDAAYIHADIRTLECQNGVFYVGTDGYFAKSTDWGQTWTTLNDGTSVKEFYAVGVSQGNVNIHMAGSQDNGTSILNENGWIEWNGGDGMEAIVHPLNQQLMIGSWQYGNRNITTNGGQTRTAVGNPEQGSGTQADWEAPLMLDPQNHMRVIHCGANLYESLDFGRNWDQIGSPGIGLIREADISFTNSDVMCVARNSAIMLTTDGGANWNSIKNNLPNYSITDIAFHPKNDSILLVTYNRYQKDNNKIYISYDRGGTWQNITYNLGNMPLRTVTLDHSDSSFIYVGSEIGVYYKSLADTEWTLYNNNLPNVTVKDLEVHFGSNTLKAATWGRGLFEYSLVGRNNYPSIDIVRISQPAGPKFSIAQYISANISNGDNMDEVKVYWSKNSTAMDNEIAMTSAGNNLWKSETGIPSDEIGARIYFRVVAKNKAGEVSETYRFNYEIIPLAYCNAIGAVGTGSDYINNVTLNGTSKNSGQDYYGDFTSTTFDLEKGKSYDLLVSLAFHWDPDSVSAWIDYNNNTDFEDEERIVFSSLNSNHQTSANFTVPNDALTNANLRMRVKSTYNNAAPSPCGEESGEVEDYTVVLRSGAGLQNNNIAFKLSPNPSSGSFTVKLTNGGIIDEVKITDISGKLVFTNAANNDSIKINANLSSGIYFISIKTGLGTGTQKIVIE
jgi:photosystem II stability/assembly factor-like uncharacterized protein